MATYIFSIDTVEVHNPKGNQPDSDWLTLVWTVNTQTFQNVHHLGGSIPAGTVLNGPWTTDPIEIADSDVVTFNYLITNRSYSGDDLKQGEQAVQDGAKVAEKIAPIAGGIVGLIFGGDPAGGAEAGKGIADAIGTAVDVISGVFDTFEGLFSKANCDGEVLHDTFVYAPMQLRLAASQLPVSKEYAGPQSDSDCGMPPHTRVLFSVKLIGDTSKQSSSNRAFNALSTAVGATSLYHIKTDGQVWTKFFPAPDKPDQWVDWFALGPNVFAFDSNLIALRTWPGATSLYIIGLDGQVWTKFFPAPDKPNQWSDWTPLGPNVFPKEATITALSTWPGATSLYIVGLDGQVWTKFFPAPDKAGQWSDWTPLGPNV